MAANRNIAKAAAALVLANVLYFLYLTFGGSTENAGYMLEHGALYVPAVLEDGEYYRMVTSMFMHFGVEHLFFNMILLYYMGTLLEPEFGSFLFLFIYLFSGLMGNAVSLLWYRMTDSYAVSAGASGAIFGLVGAAAWLVIRHHGYYKRIGIRQIVLMVVFSLANGYMEGGINNAAHIGGLLAGFLCGIIFGTAKDSRSEASW